MVSTELKWKDSPVKWIPSLHRCVYICVCASVRVCVVCVCVVCMCVYELKMRREEGIQLASIELRCEKPGGMFGGQTKAGLVNHTRQDMAAWHRSSTSAHSVANLSTSRGSPCTRGIAQ